MPIRAGCPAPASAAGASAAAAMRSRSSISRRRLNRQLSRLIRGVLPSMFDTRPTRDVPARSRAARQPGSARSPSLALTASWYHDAAFFRSPSAPRPCRTHTRRSLPAPPVAELMLERRDVASSILLSFACPLGGSNSACVAIVSSVTTRASGDAASACWRRRASSCLLPCASDVWLLNRHSGSPQHWKAAHVVPPIALAARARLAVASMNRLPSRISS